MAVHGCNLNLFPNLLYVKLLLLGAYLSLVRSEQYFEYEERASQFGAPLILSEEADLTFYSGLNHTITCESRVPITWLAPMHENEVLPHEVVEFKTNNAQRPYGSYLTLFDINAKNVNYYFCINKDSHKEKNLENLLTLYKASQIYVFVNDPNNLIVPVEHPVVTAFQYSDVIIPCKPTLKDIEVELIKMDDQSREHHIDSGNSRYDPTLGFFIKFMELPDSGHYICRSTHFHMHALDFHLYVLGDSSTNSINKPEIESNSDGHAHEGGVLELKCILDVAQNVMFSMNWILPVHSTAIKEKRAIMSPTTKIRHLTRENLQVGERKLIIKNVKKISDSGYYKCVVEDHSNNTNNQNIFITVLSQNENYINLSEPSNNYKLNVSTKLPSTEIVVQYRGYPPPNLVWYDNRGKPIASSSSDPKYNITKTSKNISLKIRNVELADYGEYRLKATNSFQQREVVFQIIVRSKPIVNIENVYAKIGEEVHLACKCDSYPRPTIVWTYTPCGMKPQWPDCSEILQYAFSEPNTLFTSINTTSQIMDLRFVPTQPGIARCIASNSEGSASAQADVLIGELEEPFLATSLNESEEIITGDRVVLMCGAVKYNYLPNLSWYKNNKLIENSSDIIIKTEEAEYSFKKKLTFQNVTLKDGGAYKCIAKRVHDYFDENRTVSLEIFDSKIPKIHFTNLRVTTEKKLAENIEFKCNFSGMPTPKIRWYQNNKEIVPTSNASHIVLLEGGIVLNIKIIKLEDEGLYKCVVSNKFGSAQKEGQLKISNLPGIKSGWIIVIGVVITVLLILVIFLFIRTFRERKVLRKMKAAGLANFSEGAVEFINPTLTLEEQAEFLPYNKRFEFPREKLKLGQQLGAGAFGVVLKATAEGILSDEKETVVAVKMVKKTADNEVMKALVSELKIMVHLGQHLNVVNLLGAITKNIAKREVMVIVEYCRYGNVQNFLLKNRKRFVNQIDPRTDQIDSSILTVEQQHSLDAECNSEYLKNGSFNYASAQSSNYNVEINSKNSTAVNSHANPERYLRHPGCKNSCKNMSTFKPEITYINFNSNDQQSTNIKCKTEGIDELDINTTVLMSWAFQVARGMDYLASRRVLHGDLAARNILLCDGNVVKICDFGLAKSMYKSNNYKKQGDLPLPIKWLALESLRDQTFSTYSDIWSFGIVMWEFFSLAKTPYPGMEADQTLYLKLKDGYRMEKPSYANRDLYDIMLQCWSVNPETRPLFNELEQRLGKMLEDDVANHYLNLNEPYLKMNKEYSKNSSTDYLSLMGCPDEVAPAPPSHDNSRAKNPSDEQKPTRTDDEVNFDLQQTNDLTPKVYFITTSKSPVTLINL